MLVSMAARVHGGTRVLRGRIATPGTIRDSRRGRHESRKELSSFEGSIQR